MSRLGTAVSVKIPSDVIFGVVIGALALLFAAVTVMHVVQLARTWRPRHRLRAIESLARSTNLAIPAEISEPLAEAAAARKRGALVGSLIALPVVPLLFRPWSDAAPDFAAAASLVGIAVVLSSTTIGAVAGGLLGRLSMRTSHRAARITPLTYADLIAPVERRLAAGCVGAGAALPALLVLSTSASWADRDLATAGDVRLLLIAGLASAGLWLALPAIARRLVAARAIAGDEHALAWSDALAARTLRDVTYLVVTLGGLSAVISVVWLGAAAPREWTVVAEIWGSIGFYLAAAAYITVIALGAVRQPERHVQRTLWPQFAHDAQ
ncbi:hypothetical protein [Demequina aestuarii]|uniref:hypothetical protein n=1 Tax=Demequina aestuarii TaxID=327095 RepID=UPI0007812329|nr:hypothetical protein [Demequina aestuarii]